MLYKFNILLLLSYLNYKIMNINSLSSSSTVQHTINNSSSYISINTLNSLFFVAFATLINAYFDKIITADSPKSHQVLILWKFCNSLIVLAILPIMLALCSLLLLSYYAQNYAGIIASSLQPSHRSRLLLLWNWSKSFT